MEILNKYENPSFDTYIIRMGKNDRIYSETITATHYKRSDNIVINLKHHNIKIKARNNPIAAIKEELTQTSQKGATMEKVQRLHYHLAIDTKKGSDAEKVLSAISTLLRKAAEEGEIRGSDFNSDMTELIDENIAFEE